MRKGREPKDPDRSVTSWLPEVDASFRDAVDPDPLVEAMVERLRSSLSGLVALDEYGRPVAWRQVVRLALGPTLGRLRDAETSLALMQRVMDLPPDGLGRVVDEFGLQTVDELAPRAVELPGLRVVDQPGPEPQPTARNMPL